MGTVNVILKYDCGTKSFADENIFGEPVWDCAELTGLFYGTVAIMTSKMAESGALPGMLAMSPTVVPITGNWLFRHVVEQIGNSDSPIQATAFLDKMNYRSVLGYDSIGEFHLFVNCGEDEYKDKIPQFMQWEADSVTPVGPGGTLVTMKRRECAGLDEAEFGDEIERMELEMNDPTDEEILPESHKRLEQLISTILDSWEVFERYDCDMPKYMAQTDGVNESGSVGVGFGGEGGPFGESCGILSGDDDMREQMTGPNGESLNAPASIGVVKVMAKMLDRVTDFALKAQGIAVQSMAKANENEKKLGAIDLTVADAMRAMDEKCNSVRDFADERISGLTQQIGTIVSKDRKRSRWSTVSTVAPIAISAAALLMEIVSHI